jgi:hypothetical protein
VRSGNNVETISREKCGKNGVLILDDMRGQY